MPLIDLTNVTFGYDGSAEHVFENLNLQLDTDWRLGLIGRNGRGKTTLLRLLRGDYAYSGKISAPVGFDYFPPDVADDRAAAGTVLAAICPDAADWELHRELSLLGVSDEVLGRPFGTLSGGERTKALLAALFLREGRFLLIDEPTNHLDMDGRAAVGRYLAGKRGFILVSHDRAFLDSCADHILALNKAGVELQRGNFSSWQENRARRDSFELAENERLKKDMKRLSDAARRAADWSDKTEQGKYGTKNSGLRVDRGYVGHKAAKMMKRSKAIAGRREEAAEAKSALLKNVETAPPLKLSGLTHHASRLASLEGVSVFYGGTAACRDVSFTVEQGDRVALCGKNGTGKSSLLRLICGETPDYAGTLRLASGLTVSHVPQDTTHLAGPPAAFAAERGLDESLFFAILRKLGLDRAQFDRDLRAFSAGQKKKALIAASLCTPAHLYVWDEPLNFIDVISRMQIEELLRGFSPTLLFVEHDRAFCDAIATKRVELG